MNRSSTIKAYSALSLCMLFWGLSFVATKIALESITTFTLIFARFAVGGCLFLVIMAVFGFPRFTRRDHGKALLTALFEPGLYFVFETIGLQHTTAPKAALIIATIPVVVLVFATLLLKERTRAGGLFGMGISLAGIAILITGDPKFSWVLGGRLLGDLLIFGAVISAACYIVCARGLGKDHSALEFTGMQVIYGALLYVPAFLWELPYLEWSAISTRSLGSLVFLTLFATVGAFLCYNYALSTVPATKASVFINAIPVVTVMAAWAILGETLTLMQALGGALVLIGVFLTNLPGLLAVPRELGEQYSQAPGFQG